MKFDHNNISPLDSRYANKISNFRQNFSESELIKIRFEIEIETDTLELYLGTTYTYSSPNSTLSFSSNQPFSTQMILSTAVFIKI